MHSLFLSKVRVNEPLQVSQQGPYAKSCPFRSPFSHISQIPYKIPLSKEIYSFSQRPYERSDLNDLQKRGHYVNRCPFPQPYLAYLSESPIKETFLQVPLIQLSRREKLHS